MKNVLAVEDGTRCKMRHSGEGELIIAHETANERIMHGDQAK